MGTFKMSGLLDGTMQIVEFDTETLTLTGDTAMVEAVDRRVAAGDEVGVTPTGPGIPASLDDPFSAYITVRESFERVLFTQGDVPDVPDEMQAELEVPDGAQA